MSNPYRRNDDKVMFDFQRGWNIEVDDHAYGMIPDVRGAGNHLDLWHAKALGRSTPERFIQVPRQNIVMQPDRQAAWNYTTSFIASRSGVYYPYSGSDLFRMGGHRSQPHEDQVNDLKPVTSSERPVLLLIRNHVSFEKCILSQLGNQVFEFFWVREDMVKQLLDHQGERVYSDFLKYNAPIVRYLCGYST